MRFKVLLIPLIFLLLGLAGLALAAPAPTLERNVLPAGGGRAGQGEMVLLSTVGQPVAGSGGSGDIFLCTGFLCGGPGGETPYAIYLPLVVRN